MNELLDDIQLNRSRNIACYHYTSPIGLEGILKNKNLRFTDSTMLNDNSEGEMIFVCLDECIDDSINKMEGTIELNKEFIDTDSEIEKIINMPISSYLTKDNETDFRKIEHNVIKEISKYSNKIISTGGGIIKNEENINLLKQNGIVIFINRPLDNLIATSSRPLSSSLDDLKKLYEERIPLYYKCADIIVNNDTRIEDVILDILNKI